MKIELHTEKETLRTALKSISDAANEIKPGEVTKHELAYWIETLEKPDERAFPGGSLKYKPGDRSSAITLNLDDEIARIILPKLVDIAKLITPAIAMYQVAAGLFRSAGGSFKDIVNSVKKAIAKTWGRDKRYCVITPVDTNTGLRAVVLVEDDGFGNIRVHSCKAFCDSVESDQTDDGGDDAAEPDGADRCSKCTGGWGCVSCDCSKKPCSADGADKQAPDTHDITVGCAQCVRDDEDDEA